MLGLSGQRLGAFGLSSNDSVWPPPLCFAYRGNHTHIEVAIPKLWELKGHRLVGKFYQCFVGFIPWFALRNYTSEVEVLI